MKNKLKSYRFLFDIDTDDTIEGETYPITLKRFCNILRGMIKTALDGGEKNINIRIEVIKDGNSM